MKTTDTNSNRSGSSRRIRRWLSNHPIAAYLVLTFAISWAAWIPQALGAGTVQPGVGWPSELPGLVGPALSAILVTAVIGGRAELADLWRRITAWRVGGWWLAVAAILLVGAVGIAVTGGVADPRELALYNGVGAGLGPLATVLLVFVVNGIGEEAGWRGFMVDRLLGRHGLTVTALLVALAWAPWHAPLFFFLGSFQGFSAGTLVGWLIGLISGSIVLTWLYRQSGRSILLVAAWHVAFNYTSSTPAASGTVAAISSSLVMAAAVVLVIVEWMKRRSHNAPERAGQPA